MLAIAMKFRINCLTQKQLNAIIQAYQDLKVLKTQDNDLTCKELETAFPDIDFYELNASAYI
jgi:hypothetical protein